MGIISAGWSAETWNSVIPNILASVAEPAELDGIIAIDRNGDERESR